MVQCLRGTSSDSMAVDFLPNQTVPGCQPIDTLHDQQGLLPKDVPRIAERKQPARKAAQRAKQRIAEWTNRSGSLPAGSSGTARGEKRQRPAGAEAKPPKSKRARHGENDQAFAPLEKRQQPLKRGQGRYRQPSKGQRADQQDQQEQQGQRQGCGAVACGSIIRWCTEQEQQGSEQLSARASEPQSSDTSLRMNLANAAADQHQVLPEIKLPSDDVLRELLRSDISDEKRKRILARVVRRERARVLYLAENDALLDEFRGTLNPVMSAAIHHACQRSQSGVQFRQKIMEAQLADAALTKVQATHWIVEVVEQATSAALQRLNTIDGYVA